MAKRGGLKKKLSKMTASGQSLETQVQRLIDQKKYSTALRKLQQGMKRDPDQHLAISEADIWLAQGKDEIEQSRYAQAESAFRQTLDRLAQKRDVKKGAPKEIYEDVFYGLAQALIFQHKSVDALDIFQSAFEDKSLPKNLGGCYLKLLFLNDKIDVVKALLDKQSKRFYAPHLHWARGAIAIKANDPIAAADHFKKMGRPATPGDCSTLWEAFALQKAEKWTLAEQAIPLRPRNFSRPGFSLFPARLQPDHPAKQLLVLCQIAHADLVPSEYIDVYQEDLPNREAAWALELVQLIQGEDLIDAANAFLNLPKAAKAAYPELEEIARSLMLLAGEQARQEQEFSDTARFWTEASRGHELEPNLALNLYKALDASQDYSSAVEQLNKIETWVKQKAQKDSKNWPKPRFNATLAQLICWAVDCHEALGRYSDVARGIAEATKLAPEHPEVIARQGLQAAAKGDRETAVDLLTQALEKGSRFYDAYNALLLCLEGDADATRSARRKFGQRFGDAGPDTEADIPTWREAIAYQNYELLEDTVRKAIANQKKPGPELRAYQIFLEAAEDEPSSSGQKITLNQKQAVSQWDALLAELSPAEQVEVIKAIYLIIYQHAKRNKKGMAALQSSYLAKITELSSQQVPGADIVHLMLVGLRSPDRIGPVAENLLSRATYPEKVLAQAQLSLHHYGVSNTMRPLLEAKLKQSPQDPHLLLANATLFPRGSGQYEKYHEQGFEVARRLQDADALKVYREEEWFTANDLTREVMGPRIGRADDLSERDMIEMVKKMARAAFGDDVPPEIMAQLVPQLLAEMAAEMGEGDFEDDFEDDDFEDDSFSPFLFPPPPPPGRKRSSKKRKSFFQL